jgi:NitT/TauT family transport system ATP-binding protein
MTTPQARVEDILPLARPVQVPVVERPYQVLPHAAIGDLTGLVGHLDQAGGRQDLPVLARDLQLEVDDLLPLMDGLAILGLGAAQEGDAVLTHLGRQVAAADVQEEKEIFRSQVMRNVQLVRQIMDQLRETTEHSFKEDALLEQLQQYFSEPEARRQLDTAIDWGRFAELFAYDDDSGELYLEEEEEEEPAGSYTPH